jgi:hypothetical protein
MNKKTIKLNEKDLTNIVKKVLSEQETEQKSIDEVISEYREKSNEYTDHMLNVKRLWEELDNIFNLFENGNYSESDINKFNDAQRQSEKDYYYKIYHRQKNEQY